MKTFAAVRICLLLIKRIESHPFETTACLLQYLDEQGFTMSKRSFERLLANIRDEFFISIRYDRNGGGYVVDFPEENDRETLIQLLDMLEQAAIFSDAFKGDNSLLQHIDFSRNSRLRGFEWLEYAVYALKHHRKVTLEYHRFGSAAPETIALKPLLLKHYQDRWYLVGFVDVKGGIRIYGLDRITAFTIEQESFKLPKDPGLKATFKNTIGINFSDNKPERLLLRVDISQAEYLRSLPLHDSQVEVRTEADGNVVFEINVVINHECKQRLLMLGAAAEVLEPETVRHWVKEELINAIALYR
jgi:hypothetical protein